jgi:hypothetical protein
MREIPQAEHLMRQFNGWKSESFFCARTHDKKHYEALFLFQLVEVQ